MRDIPIGMQEAFQEGNTAVALLAEFEFSSGTLYMWSGYGSITWKGNTYLGGGNLISLSPYQETQDMQAQGLRFSLSGVPSDLLSIAFNDNYQGRPCRLYLVLLNVLDGYIQTEDGSFILQEDGSRIFLEDAALAGYRFFTGIMDTMDSSDDGKESRLVLSAENIMTLLKRTKVRRYTDEDQRSLYPDDLGLSLIAQLQDKEIVW
jgi:hypothetical protein